MMSIALTMTVAVLIPIVMLSISILTSKKNIVNLEKATPFECGFDPASMNRLPFSIQFFMISMIFLIFDIEITILIPLIMLMKTTPTKWMMSISLLFLVILIMGLYFEYMEKSIEWKT